jgi:hypothetical protein
MKEKDILYQNGKYWIMKNKGIFYVMQDGNSLAESIAAFADYSLALAYARYKAVTTIKQKGVNHDHTETSPLDLKTPQHHTQRLPHD